MPIDENIKKHRAAMAELAGDTRGLQQPLIDPIQLLAGGITGALRAPLAMKAAAPAAPSMGEKLAAYMRWKAAMEAKHGRMVYGQ